MGREGGTAGEAVQDSIESSRSGVLRFEGQVPKPEGESEDRVLEVR